ncbi:hypothetical protein [Pontibacter akesuensis]|uniref:hypothetical protein n=1 Tax=Pontibacter akesuensis TaxID=388950 RepID=UPI001587A8A8|nr:hypothetical protein [Pontibacter akesuensis]
MRKTPASVEAGVFLLPLWLPPTMIYLTPTLSFIEGPYSKTGEGVAALFMFKYKRCS